MIKPPNLFWSRLRSLLRSTVHCARMESDMDAETSAFLTHR